jgi:hypothetical protein
MRRSVRHTCRFRRFGATRGVTVVNRRRSSQVLQHHDVNPRDFSTPMGYLCWWLLHGRTALSERHARLLRPRALVLNCIQMLQWEKLDRSNKPSNVPPLLPARVAGIMRVPPQPNPPQACYAL